MAVDGSKKKGRRKGKGSSSYKDRISGSGSSAVTRSSSPIPRQLPTNSTTKEERKTEKDKSKKSKRLEKSSAANIIPTTTTTPIPKEEKVEKNIPEPPPPEEKEENKEEEEPQLVLLGEKRRGLYECDYCRSDISQIPRVRCAVCPDFDLCLDCFATTDPTAAIAIRDAALGVAKALEDDEDEGGEKKKKKKKGGGGSGGVQVAGISAAAVNHCHTHGYRVADSTRFALFPTARGVVKLERDDDDDDDEEKEKKKARLEEEDRTADEDDTADDTRSAAPQNDNESKIKEKITKDKKEAEYIVTDDAKAVWTAEEDLRLLDAISTFGLGNWADIAEAVSNGGSLESNNDGGASSVVGGGGGSVGGGGGGSSLAGGGGANRGDAGKSARRCMERYCDDFLGRYGHILPPYTLIQVENDDEQQQDEGEKQNDDADDNEGDKKDVNDDMKDKTANNSTEAPPPTITLERKRKRLDRQSSTISSTASSIGGISTTSYSRQHSNPHLLKQQQQKKYKVIPTISLPNYEDIWPHPHIPTFSNGKEVEIGDEVGRDIAFKLEQSYVKASNATTSTKEEVDQLRKEFMQKRFLEIQQIKQKDILPQVFPPRLDDIRSLPGAELAGFMPRRGDFDMEYDNDAETILADMEFSPSDPPQDKQLKLDILEIYNAKLDERERRKQFLVERNLLDYRKNQAVDQALLPEERDLIYRMRLVARFHTPLQHEEFVRNVLKAKKLRKEIAKLQMYRRMGITSLAEAERYECDKIRREHHKIAHYQKMKEEEKAERELERKVKEGASSVGNVGGNTEDGRMEDVAGGVGSENSGGGMGGVGGPSLWRQYRGSDRKARRLRSQNSVESNTDEAEQKTVDKNTTAKTVVDGDDDTKTTNGADKDDKMDIDNAAGNKRQTSDTSKKDDTAVSEKAEQKSKEKNDTTNTNTTNLTFDITRYKGYNLLSSREADLCESLNLLPEHYLCVKRELIRESLEAGMLYSKKGGLVGSGSAGSTISSSSSSSSAARSIVKLDVEKRDNVIDFVLRAGWIPSKPSMSMMNSLTSSSSPSTASDMLTSMKKRKIQSSEGKGSVTESASSLAEKISAAMGSKSKGKSTVI